MVLDDGSDPRLCPVRRHRARRAGQPLLPGPARPWAIAALAACALLTVVLGTRYRNKAQAGRFDTALDNRIQRLPDGHRVGDIVVHLGDPITVTVLTAALIVACGVTGRWRGVVLVALSVPGAMTQCRSVKDRRHR
jgi:hypothetical protein